MQACNYKLTFQLNDTLYEQVEGAAIVFGPLLTKTRLPNVYIIELARGLFWRNIGQALLFCVSVPKPAKKKKKKEKDQYSPIRTKQVKCLLKWNVVIFLNKTLR